MSVDLDKVKQQAPHMVDLVKETNVNLDKRGFDAETNKAAVIATFDYSGSTESAPNFLYSGREQTMQHVADLAFAAGLVFDDDGLVPVSFFHDVAIDVGEVSLSNCRGFLDNARRRVSMGGTNYLAALRWIVETAGFGHVDLGGLSAPQHHEPQKRGLFGKLRHSTSAPTIQPGLRVRATAPYPTYAIFVTDGEPNWGTEGQIKEYLTLMSQLPIFVQFIGVGHHTFEFLEELDTMEGRLIDNANFFDAKEAGNNQSRMLDLLLGEFPVYYPLARTTGLIV